MVLVDEGHKVRHVLTKIHSSLAQLEAKINWFLTATPVMNTAFVGTRPHINLKHDIHSLHRTYLVD